jgi:hypothetical protein
LLSLPPKPNDNSEFIAIENWTKWRIFVRNNRKEANTAKDTAADNPLVIYGRTGDNILLQNKVHHHINLKTYYIKMTFFVSAIRAPVPELQTAYACNGHLSRNSRYLNS